MHHCLVFFQLVMPSYDSRMWVMFEVYMNHSLCSNVRRYILIPFSLFFQKKKKNLHVLVLINSKVSFIPSGRISLV